MNQSIDYSKGIYDARQLGTGRMMVLGVQHMFAMFGATVLVPLLTGLSVSTTLLCGELCPGIPDDQAGDAGGTGGREHGVDHAQPPAPAGDRQTEQQGARRDQQQKAAADQLGRAASGKPSAPLLAQGEMFRF